MKRLFDIIFSFFGLIFFLPAFLFLAIAIKLDSSGPVFYRGERTGKNNKPFRIFKFRTMTANAEASGVSSTADDDCRITKTGRFLRKYKLDEAPQFINILRGDMSFVGPRPQVKWATDLYTDEEKIVLNVQPGLTDYASLRFFHEEGEILKGSSDPDGDYMRKIHPEKTRLQMEYVKNHSFIKDIAIIVETILAVFKK